jgi:hypothetical protein
MKILITSTLLTILFFSACNKQTEQTSATDSLAVNDTIVHQAVEAKFSDFSGKPLRIPIAEGFRDPHYVLIVVPINSKIPVYTAPGDPKKIKPASYITKTIQSRWYSEKDVASTDPCLQYWETKTIHFYEIATGAGTERGWVLASDVLQVEEFDLAQYSFSGLNLKLGSMKKRYKNDHDNCFVAQTLFLHNDKFIYLIATGNEEVSLPGEGFVSLIDHPNMGSMSAVGDTDAYIFEWGVPNGKVTLKVGADGEYIKCLSYEMTAVEGDFEEGVGEGEGEMDEAGGVAEEAYDYTDEVFTKECEFSDYSVGDCGHLEFSCGDFGNAKAANLSAEDQAIWNDLAISNDDGETGNPKYVGKTFIIKYKIVPGDKCGDPSGPQYGPIEQLISFKLKK